MSTAPLTSSLAASLATHRTLCNLLLFKLTWVLLVVWQQQLLLPALLLFVLSLALHQEPRRSALPMLRIAASGLLLDQLLTSAGVFVFATGTVPLWLVLLWFAWAQALLLGLAFLQRLPLWAQALCGALCGAGSYAAGLYFEAVQYGFALLPSSLLLALLWSLLLPLHLRFARGWRPLNRSSVPATLLALLLALPAPARAEEPALQLVGQATFRYMLWPIYEASLHAREADFRFPASAPFELSLKYRRGFSREQILEETLKQWRLQGVQIPAHWPQQLTTLLPDVAAGDVLSLRVDVDLNAELRHNGLLLGRVDEAEFSLGFAGIWLATNTTRPDFRRQLLGEPQ